MRFPRLALPALVLLWPHWAAAAELDASRLSPLWGVPFAGLLLSIAVVPLLAPRFWHHHYGKVTAAWALAFLLPFAAMFGVSTAGVALVQFWPDYVHVVIVVIFFFSGQFLEGNILQPKLVGQSVGLHPVWLMFALFAFGALFGFVGVLVAVPAAAAIGVLVRFALSRYLESDLYYGQTSARGGEQEPGASEK